MVGFPIQKWRDDLGTGHMLGLKIEGPHTNRGSMGRLQIPADCLVRSIMMATIKGQLMSAMDWTHASRCSLQWRDR